MAAIHDARGVAAYYRIDLDRDFHALDSAQVERILIAADRWRYRAPRNANGSRARYFHAYLQRLARKES